MQSSIVAVVESGGPVGQYLAVIGGKYLVTKSAHLRELFNSERDARHLVGFIEELNIFGRLYPGIKFKYEFV